VHDVTPEAYVSVVGRVEPAWFVASAVLFFAGFFASYPVVTRDVSLLTAYPLWLWNRVRERISPDDPWPRLFVLLLSFNATSLLVNFVSGFFVVLPPLFAFLLGLNIGVISLEEAGAAGLAAVFVNPVAWLELPAAWMSLAIGAQLGLEAVSSGPAGAVAAFPSLAEVYACVVLPLLVAAALLEATLIRLAARKT
jgi:uncharacterized membrane protein SpoIIM required for sporulation